MWWGSSVWPLNDNSQGCSDSLSGWPRSCWRGELAGMGSNVSVRIESSYIIDLRELDMKHVKDFTFIHDSSYIEGQLQRCQKLCVHFLITA
ncbi:hypothetical protein DsansV1_C08g0078261 [Dioscorea sansibarensis]